MQEYRVNEYITLKLENKKTNIYIKDELFQQCKFLLINILAEEVSSLDKINSIDDAADLLDDSLEEVEGFVYNISPEEEFWAHSSNLQAWYEHGYDTRLLHSNLSFALLRKLYVLGDPLARKKFKEEVAYRFLFGNYKIQDFLKAEHFFRVLSKEEVLSLVDENGIILKLERYLGKNLKLNTLRYPNPCGIVIEQGEITWLSLDNTGLKNVPEVIKGLKSLKSLILERNSLATLPEWIGGFSHLESLNISNNRLENIPESIGELRKLKQLNLDHNNLKKVPESIGNLAELEILYLDHNKIRTLPKTLGSLKMLKKLYISANHLETLPESIGKLNTLTNLAIYSNRIKFLPESIRHLSSLRVLRMGQNPIQKLPNSINSIESLETLSLKGIDETVWNLTEYNKKKIKIYK